MVHDIVMQYFHTLQTDHHKKYSYHCNNAKLLHNYSLCSLPCIFCALMHLFCKFIAFNLIYFLALLFKRMIMLIKKEGCNEKSYTSSFEISNILRRKYHCTLSTFYLVSLLRERMESFFLN